MRNNEILKCIGLLHIRIVETVRSHRRNVEIPNSVAWIISDYCAYDLYTFKQSITRLMTNFNCSMVNILVT